MNLSNYRFLPATLGIIILFASFIACNSTMQSPYEDFIKEGEIIYPSKVDSIIIYPGNNRMLVEFLKPDDPTLRKARIYWKNKQDSMDVSIEGQDTVRVFIDSLQQEGTYAVNIHLYDKEGNVSIGESATGRVYGNTYSRSLSNRPTHSVGLKTEGNGSIIIDWASPSTEGIGSILTYVDTTDAEKSIFVPNDSTETEIFDLKDQDVGNLEYQTMFKPDSMSVDTFYTDQKTVEISEIVLQNAIFPITGVKNNSYKNGKFGTPDVWTVNNATKNYPGNTGGWRSTSNELGVATYPSDASLPQNGKIYQTVKLPAGSYTMSVDFSAQNGDSDRYLAVAECDSLPDIADVSTQTLAYADFDVNKVDFNLSQQTKISLGFLYNMPQHNQNFFIKNVRLKYSP